MYYNLAKLSLSCLSLDMKTIYALEGLGVTMSPRAGAALVYYKRSILIDIVVSYISLLICLFL